MSSEERVAPVNRPSRPSRRRRCLSREHTIQIVSALVLPLLLGVFTVVITFQQQKVARDQWLEDRNELREQRLEDRNESQQQRIEDRERRAKAASTRDEYRKCTTRGPATRQH